MRTITDLIFRVSNSNSNKWFTLLHNTNNPAKGVYWWQRLAPLDPHFQRWLSGANLVNRQPRPNRDHREASQSSGRPRRNPVWPVRESDCVTSFKIRHSASITLGSSRNRPAECPSIACWETRHTKRRNLSEWQDRTKTLNLVLPAAWLSLNVWAVLCLSRKTRFFSASEDYTCCSVGHRKKTWYFVCLKTLLGTLMDSSVDSD